MQTALLILPNFALILVGFALARGFDYGRDFWSGLEKLNYFVLFPALLVHSLALAKLDLASLATISASAAGLMIAGMALSWLAPRLFTVEARVAASCFQCGFRFSTYIGFAVAGSLYGAEGVAMGAVVFGTVIPLANVGAVAMLAAHARVNFWREIVRNPLLLATVAGFAWNLSGLAMPQFLDQTLALLSQAALAAGLLAVGAALRIGRGTVPVGAHAWWLAVKLLVTPLAAWGLIRSLGFGGTEAGILLVWAALPTAPAAYILAVRMGGDGESVATQVTAGTLLSMATIPAWMALLRTSA